MQILRSILRLLRRPNVATASAPMHRLSSPPRPLLSFMASAPPRWWPAELARRVFPLMAAPNSPIRRVSRFPHGPRSMATFSKVKGDESSKPYRLLPISSANVSIISQGNKHPVITQGIKNTETWGPISELTDEDERRNEDACRTTSEDIGGPRDTREQILNLTGCEEDRRSATVDQRGGDPRGQIVNLTGYEEGRRSATEDQREGIVVSNDEEVSDDEEYTISNILANSRHRDGSIYRGMDVWWKEEYRIADRNETRLDAMVLSDPTNCIIDDGTCLNHYPRPMLQFLSLELAKITVDSGFVELYGYIAVRDDLDPLLNYVVNVSRDDPIIVEQGSLINMSGPKRGIQFSDLALIEYDMRIKTGEHEKDDLQLMDGASIIGPAGTWNQPFTIHIPGDCGAVDITLSRLQRAVEATVEVAISEVRSSFNLSLGCLTSGLDEEIQLSAGAISESHGLKRSVVAVKMDSLIDLKFKIGTLSCSSNQHCCSFNAKTHGHDTQEMKTDFALISVRVTWSTLPRVL